MFSFLKTKKSAGVPITPAVHRLIARANDARDTSAWDDAAQCYRAAVSADPTLVHIWIQLGHAEKERKQFDAAEAAYLRAAVLAPQEADPLLHLGHIYKLTGNVAGALRSYLQAARLDPTSPDVIEELQRFIAGTTVSGRTDLIALIRGAIFGEIDDSSLHDAIRAAGNQALLLDVSSQIAAIMAGRSFDDLGLAGGRLAPLVIEAAGRPAMMCAHVAGYSRWLPISADQFARITALGRAIGAIGPQKRQDAITELDLSFLLSESFEMPAGATLVDLDADCAPADHALFVQDARQAYAVRYVAFGANMPADLAVRADIRVDKRAGDLTIEAIVDAIGGSVAAAPAPSVPTARLGRIESIGTGRAGGVFRVGTGWLPQESWGCWAAMPGADLEVALPASHDLRLYLQLKALPRELTRYQISLADGRQIHGEIERGENKWVVIGSLPVSDGIFKLRIRGEISRLVKIRGSMRELPAMIGVTGLFFCEQDDRAARMALLEATTLGDLESLY